MILELGPAEVSGFNASGIHCGIKYKKLGLGLIYADKPYPTAAVYTKNVVRSGTIDVTKKHLGNGMAQAIIVNSGNANACTGTDYEDALKMCEIAADWLETSVEDVVVASTGVIGVTLPVEKIEANITKLAEGMHVNQEASQNFVRAIMTTDLVPKIAGTQFVLAGNKATIGGAAKGSGMIYPNMGTMLGFITTDAAITPEFLQKALSEVTESTFNSISVDGDTSTNDMVVIMASGLAENALIDSECENYETFKENLKAVCLTLAKKIAADGEGATKLITCEVAGFQTKADAKKAAMSVIGSSLVKTAMAGEDANWGRVLAAMGYSGVTFDQKAVDISFESVAGKVTVCEGGAGLDFDETVAKKVLSEKEITINVEVKTAGHEAKWTAYGCDLTSEYVKINGDKRT